MNFLELLKLKIWFFSVLGHQHLVTWRFYFENFCKFFYIILRIGISWKKGESFIWFGQLFQKLLRFNHRAQYLVISTWLCFSSERVKVNNKKKFLSPEKLISGKVFKKILNSNILKPKEIVSFFVLFSPYLPKGSSSIFKLTKSRMKDITLTPNFFRIHNGGVRTCFVVVEQRHF